MEFCDGMRFADCRDWVIDCNDYGQNFYDVYMVHKKTAKTIQVLCATVYSGDVNTKGNSLLDELCVANINKTLTPKRYYLKNDDNGQYFVTGKGTASNIVHIARVMKI